MPLRQARRLGPPSGHYILNVAIEEVVDCIYMLHGQFVPNKKWKLAHLVKCSVISLAQATLLNDALRCDPTSMADLVRRIDALEKFCHGVEGLLDGGSLALESRRRFQSRIQFLDQTFADSVSKNVNGSVGGTVRDIANYSLCESSVDLANTLANYSSLGPWKTLMPEVRAQLKPEVDGGHPDASSHIQHAHTA